LTFLVQAIKQVQKELGERNKGGLVKSYIEEHILPHFHAFEILMAPYTVGHFKVSMVLEEMGYRFKEGERFKFYLTNTLEMKEPRQASFLIDLTKEGQEAKKIKEDIPILVVFGNPPYSVSSENKSDFIEDLMDTYKEDVRKERNIQPLSDDYIKFIRFGHWKIEQAGRGILGFITNNSYLSGVIHRGIRRKLLDTFDEIYLLNLHGSTRINEPKPEDIKDENVFDIRQGVAIALYLKLEKPQKEKKVYYSDLWGLREKKYAYLFGNDVQSTSWQELKPVAAYHFFVPKDFALQEEYEKFWKITEIFAECLNGLVTSRDHFVVGFTKEEVVRRLKVFTGNLPDELVKERLRLKDTGTWRLSEARRKVKGKRLDEKIYPYAYRPFDTRWICYDSVLVDRDRWPFMRHLLRENVAIVTSKQFASRKYFVAFCTDKITDKSSQAYAPNYVFPLYSHSGRPEELLFDDETGKSSCIPNLTSEFLQAMEDSLGSEPSPENILHYVYAVLYSPTYRKRYQEFLKIDFPRVPLPRNHDVFKELSNLGRELVELHLLKASALDETEIGFPVGGSNTVKKVSDDEESWKVSINKEQYFEGISKEVWEYQIGAYQVMEKYLKDRKGRKLSLDEINHYMKVAKAIRLTIELQEKIDEVFVK